MPSGWPALGNVHELMCFNRLAFDDPAAGWGGMVERVPLVVLFFTAFNLLERRPRWSAGGVAVVYSPRLHVMTGAGTMGKTCVVPCSLPQGLAAVWQGGARPMPERHTGAADTIYSYQSSRKRLRECWIGIHP